MTDYWLNKLIFDLQEAGGKGLWTDAEKRLGPPHRSGTAFIEAETEQGKHAEADRHQVCGFQGHQVGACEQEKRRRNHDGGDNGQIVLHH